jgi:hypothetical protein
MFKKYVILFFFAFLIILQVVVGQEKKENLPDTVMAKKAVRKEQRKIARQNLNPHFRLSFNSTYSFLSTQLRFITPSGLISFQVGLEDNLGLQDKDWIFSSNIVYRITPRSGLFGMYYGLNRNSTFTLKNDIYLPNDTIKAGSFIRPYFNTQVFSIGYLFSILTAEETFLAAYFNLYIMNLKTGIQTNLPIQDFNYHFLVPLPNIGLLMDFKLQKWLHLMGGLGVFFLNDINGLGGNTHEFYVYLSFQPTKWFGVNVGYQEFYVFVREYLDDYNMNIKYDFNGPSMSLKFLF